MKKFIVIISCCISLLFGNVAAAATYEDVMNGNTDENYGIMPLTAENNFVGYFSTIPPDWFQIEKSVSISFWVEDGPETKDRTYIKTNTLDFTDYVSYTYYGIMFNITINDYGAFTSAFASSHDGEDGFFIRPVHNSSQSSQSGISYYPYITKSDITLGEPFLCYVYFEITNGDFVVNFNDYWEDECWFGINTVNSFTDQSYFNVNSVTMFGTNTVEEPPPEPSGPTLDENVQSITDALTGDSEGAAKMDEANDMISGSLDEIEQVEKQITDQAAQDLQDFNFDEYVNIFGQFYPQEFLVVGEWLNTYIAKSSSYSTVLVFALSIALISVVLGIFNYTQRMEEDKIKKERSERYQRSRGRY